MTTDNGPRPGARRTTCPPTPHRTRSYGRPRKRPPRRVPARRGRSRTADAAVAWSSRRPPRTGCTRAPAPPRTSASSRGRRARRSSTSDPWRALRILSEFVEGFDALAELGPADHGLRVGPARPRATPPTSWPARSAASSREGLRGDHRRRAGRHGGREPRLPGGRRPLRRLQHRAAPRAGASTRTSTSASSSATSSRARRCS